MSNNETRCEINIHHADIKLNTEDDAFQLNGNLTIILRNVLIYSKDDGIYAGFNLVLGKEEVPLSELFANILHNYEALEAMTIRIFSGKINCTVTDNGINSFGGESGNEPFRPGPFPPDENDTRP